MTYDDLRKTLGTQVEIAEALGMKQPTISQWRKKGIPIERQWQIQLVTGGRLQADSLREQKVGAGRTA